MHPSDWEDKNLIFNYYLTQAVLGDVGTDSRKVRLFGEVKKLK